MVSLDCGCEAYNTRGRSREQEASNMPLPSQPNSGTLLAKTGPFAEHLGHTIGAIGLLAKTACLEQLGSFPPLLIPLAADAICLLAVGTTNRTLVASERRALAVTSTLSAELLVAFLACIKQIAAVAVMRSVGTIIPGRMTSVAMRVFDTIAAEIFAAALTKVGVESIIVSVAEILEAHVARIWLIDCWMPGFFPCAVI